MKNQPPKFVSYILPKISNIYWMAAFFGLLIYGRQKMNADGDLALHLSMGRYILENRQIPLQDVFSHTLAGQPAAQHKWLAQLIFAYLERLFGLEGIVLLCALVIACTFWFVYKHATDTTRSILSIVAVVTLAMVTSMIHWLIRPHVFTFLFLAAWMLVLQMLRKGKLRRWWLLPAMMLMWVNTHGGFIAGIVTWATFGLGVGYDASFGRIPADEPLPVNFWRYYLLGGAGALGTTLLNPSGIGLWNLIIFHLGNRYLADITIEFQSPNFHEPTFWPFLIMIGLLLVVTGLRQKKMDAGPLFTAIVWLFFGLYSARNIPLFAIVSTPLLAQGLDEFFSMSASKIKFIGRLKQIDIRLQAVDSQLKGVLWPVLSILVAVVGLSLGMRFDFEGQGYDFDPEVFPVAAVDWLIENPQEGEMFNDFMWGGYLQLRLWPEKRVFIDSNSDFYGEAFVRQYMQVMQLEEGWEGVLDQYDVDWAILPQDIRAAQALQTDLGWEVVYEDGVAVILRRE